MPADTIIQPSLRNIEEYAQDVLNIADSVVLGSPLGPDLEAAISLAGGVVRRLRA